MLPIAVELELVNVTIARSASPVVVFTASLSCSSRVVMAPVVELESASIARSASGFLYYVSLTGVTGARAHLDSGIAEHMRELRSVTDLPIGVGFGISTPAQAAEVATMADAVVVGSAISLVIEAHARSGDAPAAVGELVGAMKEAMKSARRTERAPAAEESNG